MPLEIQTGSNKIQTVFVVKDNVTYEIHQDEVIETEPGKFKSVKFRHTFYKSGEFFFTRSEAFASCQRQNRNEFN